MSATVETGVWQALRARVATLPGFTINWPMEPFTPPSAGGKLLPFVECRHMPNRVNRVFIGSDAPQERPGILQITLCWPASEIGTGSGKTHPDVLIQRAGEIAAHFPTDHRMTFQGVSVRVERAPDVAQPYRDDAYWRAPVSVRYRCYA
ncbi:phage tail terminator-like protein [Aquamicrobium sp. LC103]|uniref:phage tail terminator-like protein n=1 Tax=Aquamicrobium sp. LC103 TaxID=1120658 RepID=UPI00063EA1C5|nr:phage tail terminator-like protein [Aquamicrobium sp. LC103]TKT79974.1 hypothetical protein XW59_006320 [Aquamicrobium sp. LC103]